MSNGATHPTDPIWTLEEVLDRLRFRQSRQELSPMIQLSIHAHSTPRILVRVPGYLDVLRWTAAMHRSDQPERFICREENLVVYCAEMPDVFGSGWLMEVVARITMPISVPRDEVLDAAESATITRADTDPVVAGAVLALSGAVAS